MLLTRSFKALAGLLPGTVLQNLGGTRAVWRLAKLDKLRKNTAEQKVVLQCSSHFRMFHFMIFCFMMCFPHLFLRFFLIFSSGFSSSFPQVFLIVSIVSKAMWRSGAPPFWGTTGASEVQASGVGICTTDQLVHNFSHQQELNSLIHGV